MANLLGILIIIVGFSAPFLSNGRVPATLLFWLGFLLLLWPNKNFAGRFPWLKGARIGLAVNISGTLLLFLFLYTATQTAASSNYFVFLILKGASSLFNPVSSIFDLLVPYEQIQMQDWSSLFETSFIRASMLSFCNILVFISIGAIAGKVLFLRANEMNSKGH